MPCRRSLERYSPMAQGSQVAVVLVNNSQPPSPALSASQNRDTRTSSDDSCLSPSSGVILPTLAEVTFRPDSFHCCSFTAVVREGCHGQGVSFGQLAQLIKNIGHIGIIEDFTIKPLQPHTFLLSGCSRSTSSQVSSGTGTKLNAEADPSHRDSRTTRSHAKSTNARALASQSEASSSEDNSESSDGDVKSGSDNDKDSSGEEQDHSNRGKRSPWDDIDEQRLLAYKKEGKSWEWIFKKFPGRTRAAVRTRWTMVQREVK